MKIFFHAIIAWIERDYLSLTLWAGIRAFKEAHAFEGSDGCLDILFFARDKELSDKAAEKLAELYPET